MAQEKAALSKIAGGNLAHMLWQRRISQKEFAAIVDRTPRTVRRWMYEIPLPSAARFLHNIRIKQFQTGKIVAEFCYMVLPKFSFQFSNPFFLNRSGEAGSVKISMSGSTIQQRFSLMENQTELDVSLGNQGLCCKLAVPKINITIDGENALYWPEHIWYKAIPQTTFLQIEAPESVSVRPMLGPLPLQHLKNKKIFDLGNQLTTILQQSDLCISGKYTLSRESKENSIFFTTVRKFKGLEAEVIICIDIDKETFSSPQERNVFYVGTSRAMAYLDLLSLSSPEELATAIDVGEIYSKRPRAIKAVRDCLKVKIASAFDLTDDMDS